MAARLLRRWTLAGFSAVDLWGVGSRLKPPPVYSEVSAVRLPKEQRKLGLPYKRDFAPDSKRRLGNGPPREPLQCKNRRFVLRLLLVQKGGGGLVSFLTGRAGDSGPIRLPPQREKGGVYKYNPPLD